jgi:hypothetical protein
MEQLRHLIVFELSTHSVPPSHFLSLVSELPLSQAVGIVRLLLIPINIVRIFNIELIKRHSFLLLGAVIASVIAFVGMIVYFAEALARNRKSRLI